MTKPLERQGGFLQEDTASAVLEFALDRKIPEWVPADTTKPILDIGPGTKYIEFAKAHRMEWPEFNFDGQMTLAPESWIAERPICEGRDPLPFGDNEVGGIFAINILEHLWDPRWLIQEAARVLAPGCPFTIFVPHPDSIMYKQDLDHKHRFVLDTWRNYLHSDYYDKGRCTGGGGRVPLDVGYNMIHAVKEENVGILTQLIKRGEA